MLRRASVARRGEAGGEPALSIPLARLYRLTHQIARPPGDRAARTQHGGGCVLFAPSHTSTEFQSGIAGRLSAFLIAVNFYSD